MVWSKVGGTDESFSPHHRCHHHLRELFVHLWDGGDSEMMAESNDGTGRSIDWRSLEN